MITRTAPDLYAVTCDEPGCERILITDAGWAQEAKSAARANGWGLTSTMADSSAIVARQWCPTHRGLS